MLLNIIQKAIPFLILPILTRYLSPADFGIIAIFTTTLAFLSPFVHLQMGSYVVINYYNKPQLFTKQLLSNILIVAFVMAILITIISIPFLAWLKEYLSLPIWTILLLPIVCFVSNLQTQNLLIQRNKEKPFIYGAYSIANIILTLGLALYFIVFLKYGWYGRVIPMIFLPFVFFILHFYHLYRQDLINIQFDGDLLKETLNFSIPLIPTVFGISAINLADRYFIQFIKGEEALGYYSIGYSFGMIVNFVTAAFEMAFVPFIYKILANKEKLEKNKFRLVQFSYIYLVVIIGVAVFGTLFSHLLIDWGFLPSSYKASKKYIFWVSMGYVLWGMVNIIGVYISLTKKTKYIFYTIMTGVVLNTVLNYILIHEYGAIGAAYSTAITFLVILVIYWLISAKIYPMPWLDKRILEFSLKDIKQLLKE